MKIRCTACGRAYEIPDERLKAFSGTLTLPCPSCKAPITVELPQDTGGHAMEGGRERLEGDALKERILKTMKDLPAMPQVAQKAREVVANPSSSFKDLAMVIETDQAIATRILRIANSPFYGLSGKISSVQHASVILGTKTLMEILNLACSSEILGQRLPGYDLDAGELWKHSLAVAAASRIIALKVDKALEQDAFSAGLIHDAGKLILDPHILERKEEFKAFVERGDKTFLSAEQGILGFDHARLAWDACESWRIPEHIARAVGCHHDPTPSNGDLLCFVVHMADAVAMMSGIGAGLDGLLYTVHPDAARMLGLTPDDIGEIMGEIADYVDK
ncbi:MAG TPA: HDOD domain-containing protein, partial [Deltaproteobacteria bacterium]|nr:HDOD domain-containing protein [Deltaproteobacteria bacterium]